jgi:fibrillarin-like rRNA methylase
VRNAGNGGPTQLTAQACKHADIMANLSNTDVIYIGAASVGATTGIALNAGDVYSVEITNTNLLYALSIVDNEDINVVTYG